MKPGDLVILRTTGQRLTVKAVDNTSMVLCCWMDKDGHGNAVECKAAFNWQELRFPSDEERRGEATEVEDTPKKKKSKKAKDADEDAEDSSDAGESVHESGGGSRDREAESGQ